LPETWPTVAQNPSAAIPNTTGSSEVTSGMQFV